VSKKPARREWKGRPDKKQKRWQSQKEAKEKTGSNEKGQRGND